MAYCLCLSELRDRGATQTAFTPEKASSLGIPLETQMERNKVVPIRRLC